ncbi:hypothetical protein M231_05757 [Tremella mesenterica]|uniref:ubiquitinyl hydrolase 1 n=1 Tax=Tremella mesenterica TaxID=5217 RepID=A0A4Q1BHC1_TREME|nr:hypothetical protein M231_05757 [Tremella mesenterica]
MDLVPYIYWEDQEPGSQLCAQHCFLDLAENATLSPSRQNTKSFNYDDTGFFSISVLERALQVWDLTLVRWRGEAMRDYQEFPEQQAGFILNLSSHWFSLRRFSTTKRWYNLNSFLPEGPEWISPTYLRLVLTQAEKEGYSVFCVRRSAEGLAEGEGWGDGGVAHLPESPADAMALQLGEPTGRTGGASTNPDQPSVDPSPPPATVWTVPSSPPIAAPPGPSRPPPREQDLFPETLEEMIPSPSPAPRSRPQPQPASRLFDPLQTPEEEEEDEEVDETYMVPMDFRHDNRRYDDEDQALQAALRASMEDLPEGWEAPKLDIKPIPRKPSLPAIPSGVGVSSPPALPATTVSPNPVTGKVPETAKDKSETEPVIVEDEDDGPTEDISPEEIRRRRIAKFANP